MQQVNFELDDVHLSGEFLAEKTGQYAEKIIYILIGKIIIFKNPLNEKKATEKKFQVKKRRCFPLYIP